MSINIVVKKNFDKRHDAEFIHGDLMLRFQTAPKKAILAMIAVDVTMGGGAKFNAKQFPSVSTARIARGQGFCN